VIRTLTELGTPTDALSLLYAAIAAAVAFGAALGVVVVLLTAAAWSGD